MSLWPTPLIVGLLAGCYRSICIHGFPLPSNAPGTSFILE
jgi:hypothetical protein